MIRPLEGRVNPLIAVRLGGMRRAPGAFLSHPLGSLRVVLLALDLDGVVCDLTGGVAGRLRARFGLDDEPSTWSSYDLSHLAGRVPEGELRSFLDATFLDLGLYSAAPACEGAVRGVRALVAAGWDVVAVTARPRSLAEVTRSWLAAVGVPVDDVRHAPFLGKSSVVAALGGDAAVEDHPHEAELLGGVCEAFLFDRPWNAAHLPSRCRRVSSWDDVVGRLCRRPERRAS